jgi:uncharacterized membrane protein
VTATDRLVAVLVTICAGISAGVFFAFSTFVMPALHRLSPSNSISAMQAINRAAPNGAFMTVLFAPLAGIGWLMFSVARRGGATSALLIAGAACFVLGLVVLVVYHVPHNDALDKLPPTTANAAGKWRDYYGGWTAWNHVRTLAFTTATACFAFALRAR